MKIALSSRVIWGLVAVTAATVLGCGPDDSRRRAPAARLEGVLVEADTGPRNVAPNEDLPVQVTVHGNLRTSRPPEDLQFGDKVLTGPKGIAVVALTSGYQVILDPETEMTIEQQSVFVSVGRVMVKKLGEIKEPLSVRTEIGVAAVEGTQFVVEIDTVRGMQVSVIEGTVRVYSPQGQWQDTVSYLAGERGVARRGAVTRMSPFDSSSVRMLRGRILKIERASPAGSRLQPGARDGLRLPNVVGKDPATAGADLEREGVKVVVDTVITGSSEPGRVVGVSSSLTRTLRAGDVVRIQVEDTARAGDLPNVTGKSLLGAAALLRDRGITAIDTTVVDTPNVPSGTVLGATRTRIGTVGIRIARPAIAGCRVPSLTGMTEERAAGALRTARLRVGAITRLAGTTVTRQQPAAGGAAVCGAAVNFTLGVSR